jgi:hypothetical protein
MTTRERRELIFDLIKDELVQNGEISWYCLRNKIEKNISKNSINWLEVRNIIQYMLNNKVIVRKPDLTSETYLYNLK